MPVSLKAFLSSRSVEASAPCRVDMGGTLDISTFYYPLRHFNPCTFNIALNMRTTVRLSSYQDGLVRVSSKGFEPAEFPCREAPFDHPLGLIFAIAAYFDADGVHVEIESESPVRAALGGSSVAAVALIGAFSCVMERIGGYRNLYRREIAILAHALEESVAGVPCGLQDQLAAAYGGINAWHWFGRVKEAVFEKDDIFKKSDYEGVERHMLVAYCGKTHVSRDINSAWIRQFVRGETRRRWEEIIRCTQDFINAMKRQDCDGAAAAMNRETAIRLDMTPAVLNDVGRQLVAAAKANGCGARFTGAGGGGCIWAMGEEGNIDSLRPEWEKLLGGVESARLLANKIDTDGLILPVL